MRPRLLVATLLTLAHCSKPQTGTAPLGSAPLARAPSARATPSTEVQAAPPLASRTATPTPSDGLLTSIGAPELRSRLRLSGRKGTIVNTFASWCGPCRSELPMLQALADNLGRQGIGVILVSVDEPEDNEKARAFLNSLELRLPSYIAARPLGAFKEGLYPRWPGMVPATFLFDGRGVARYFWGGPVRDEEILSIVEGFLAGKTIDGESDFTLAPGTVEH